MHSSIDNFQDFCLREFPLCSLFFLSSRANSLVYIHIYFFEKLNVEGILKAISSHTEIVGS